jgi:hypothetical protein
MSVEGFANQTTAFMKSIPALFSTLLLLSCWKYNGHPYSENQKVWGNKPVYAAKTEVQKIFYDPNKHAYQIPGNIYVFRNFIFQVDVGHGIHVIDNTVPVHADRIGFITLAGCQQISIKGSYLYTNSFKDLRPIL